MLGRQKGSFSFLFVPIFAIMRSTVDFFFQRLRGALVFRIQVDPIETTNLKKSQPALDLSSLKELFE